jgi:hypothetical protein
MTDTVNAKLIRQLELLTEFAPRLRSAGFQSLTIDGITMVLAPPEPAPPEPTKDDEKPKRDLDDVVTYGLPEGAEVPGFRRPDDL